jgi:hypothetical protein
MVTNMTFCSCIEMIVLALSMVLMSLLECWNRNFEHIGEGNTTPVKMCWQLSILIRGSHMCYLDGKDLLMMRSFLLTTCLDI